jgi:hypothetical protein
MSLKMTADDGEKVLEITTLSEEQIERDPTAGIGFECPCGSRHTVALDEAAIMTDYRDMDEHDDVAVKCPDCA